MAYGGAAYDEYYWMAATPRVDGTGGDASGDDSASVVPRKAYLSAGDG